MPSSIGHSLASVGVGWAVARPAATRRTLVIQGLLFAAIGVAPDLDLLIGRHSAETHSLGAAVIVAAIAAWGLWPVAATRWRVFVAVLLAWAVHPTLDMLALDTSAPHGVMYLWPVSQEHYQTGWSVFAAISRRYWLPGFVEHTVLAVARELLILVPVLLAVWWWRRK
jgi:membrane-bound metal-dependent hydrolase YbcI (DUF457 family)